MNPEPQQSQLQSSFPLDIPNKLQRSCSLTANAMRTCEAKYIQPQVIMPSQMSIISCNSSSNSKRAESQSFMQYNTLPLKQNTSFQLPLSSKVLFSPSVVAASANQHKSPACITTPRSFKQGAAGQESAALVPICIAMKSASPLRLACNSPSTITIISNSSSQWSFKDHGEFRDRSNSQIQIDMSASNSSSSTYSQQSFQRIIPSASQQQQQSQALPQQYQSQTLSNNNHSATPLSALNATQFQSASVRALMDTFQKHKDLVQKQARSSSSYSSSSSSSSSSSTPSQQLSDSRTLSIRNDLSHSSSTLSLQALTSIPPGCCALAKISSRQVISQEEKVRIASFAKKGSLEDAQIITTPRKADACTVLTNQIGQPKQERSYTRKEEKLSKEQQGLRCLQSTLNSKSSSPKEHNNILTEIQLNITSNDEVQASNKRSAATNSTKTTKKQLAQQPFRQPKDSEKLQDRYKEENNKSSSTMIIIHHAQQADDDDNSKEDQQTDKHASQQDTNQQQQEESAYAFLQQHHSQPQHCSKDSSIQQQQSQPSSSIVQPTEMIPQDQRINSQVDQHPKDSQMQDYDSQYYDMDIRTNTEEYCIAEATNTDRDGIEDKDEWKYPVPQQLKSTSVTDSPHEHIVMMITPEELLAEKYRNNKSDFRIDEEIEEESIVSDVYLTLSPCLSGNKQQLSQLQHSPWQLSRCQGEQQKNIIDQLLLLPSSHSHHPSVETNIHTSDHLQYKTIQQESTVVCSDSTPAGNIHHCYPKNCSDASTSPIRAILPADNINHEDITTQSHDIRFSSEDSSSQLLADSEILINGQQSTVRLREQEQEQEEERKLEDDYQNRKRQIQGEIKTKQKQRKQQRQAANPERTTNVPQSSSLSNSNSNTSNSNSCTAASSKGDTFISITDASISQSMQLIALQKREEILDRIKHIDAQLLVHQQKQQQALLAKTSTRKGKLDTQVTAKNRPKSADRADNQPLAVQKPNNQPKPFASTSRDSPCALSQNAPVVPQLRASTPSARSSAPQFSAKQQRSSDSAKSLSKQNRHNFLDESGGSKACYSSKKLTGFIILTDSQTVNRTPKWEHMQAQKNLWNKGQRRDLKFTEDSSSSLKIDSNHKENQLAGMITTATTVTKNNIGNVQNKSQRSSSIKLTSSNTNNNKQSAPLGVINLFELQNKPKEDPSVAALTSKAFNIYPYTAAAATGTLTPRQSSALQYHPLHQPFFKNSTPSSIGKSKLDYKMTSVFGKKQPSSKSSSKMTPNSNNKNNAHNNLSTPNAANFQKVNAFQPATFSIIPIVQEIDLEAEHAIKMNSQEHQHNHNNNNNNNNSLSLLHNSKDYLNFNTYSPQSSKHSNERLTRHHRYQICEGAEGFDDEEFSPIPQRTKGEEDMSDISGLNPSSSNETNQ